MDLTSEPRLFRALLILISAGIRGKMQDRFLGVTPRVKKSKHHTRGYESHLRGY